MADRVKGITIELNGDVTPLNKALSGANKEIRNTQTALKDVEKLLKLDPTNVDLLAQRQRLLSQAVEETRKKLDTLKDAEKQAQEQFAKGEISQQQYDALQREIIATEQELARLEKAAAQSNVVLARIGAVAQEISDKTGKWADKTRGLSLAAAGVVTALGGAALSTVRMSDDLNYLAQQTGFTTDELQMMQYAADRVDVSLEDITGAATRLKRQMGSTSSEIVSTWNRLGVSVRNANGELRSSTEVFWETVQALGEIENETERDTVAMQLFGRSADQLAGIIDDGGAALRTYGQEARNAGLILSGDTLNGLNEVNDKLDKLKAEMQAVIAVNGAKVVEAFLPLIDSASKGLTSLVQKVAEMDAGQLKFIATAAGVIAGVSPVLSLISKVSGAVSALMPILAKLNVVMLANPAAAIAVGVTALAAAIIAIGIAASDSKSQLDELTVAADNVGAAVDKANASYNENSKAIETNYQKAQLYFQRLEHLEKQTSLTAQEQHELAMIVGELNGMYPELNIQIDQNTGKLADNIYNIEAQTKALKEAAIQQALQEKYQGILEAMAEAQLEVYENQIKLAQAEENLTQKRDEANRATMAYLQAQEDFNEAYDRGASDLANYRSAMEEAYRQMILANDAVDDAQSEIDNLNEAIAKGQSTVQDYANQYDEAVKGIASLLSSEGQKAGEAFMEGMAKGIRNKTPTVETQAGSAARSVTGKAKSELRIASPSKVAEEIGRYWDLGLVRGMEQGQAEVEDTSAEVAQMMIPTNNYSTNTTTNHNVGGISVTVNAAPGQDVQQLAEAVMDEIQAAVEREGAAL